MKSFLVFILNLSTVAVFGVASTTTTRAQTPSAASPESRLNKEWFARLKAFTDREILPMLKTWRRELTASIPKEKIAELQRMFSTGSFMSSCDNPGSKGALLADSTRDIVGMYGRILDSLIDRTRPSVEAWHKELKSIGTVWFTQHPDATEVYPVDWVTLMQYLLRIKPSDYLFLALNDWKLDWEPKCVIMSALPTKH